RLLLAGGSRNALTRCAATRCQPMPYTLAAFWLGAANFSQRMGPTWHCYLGKRTQQTEHPAFPSPSFCYHFPNNHAERKGPRGTSLAAYSTIIVSIFKSNRHLGSHELEISIESHHDKYL